MPSTKQWSRLSSRTAELSDFSHNPTPVFPILEENRGSLCFSRSTSAELIRVQTLEFR